MISFNCDFFILKYCCYIRWSSRCSFSDCSCL